MNNINRVNQSIIVSRAGKPAQTNQTSSLHGRALSSPPGGGLVKLSDKVAVQGRQLQQGEKINLKKEIVVTDMHGNKAVVKVKHLAQALLISKSQVREASKGGKEDFAKNLAEKKGEYEKAFTKFEKNKKIQKDGQKGSLTAKQLMKATAHAELKLKEDESTFKRLGLLKGKVIVTKQHDRNILVMKEVKLLGKGTFGKAKLYETADKTGLQQEVIKFARHHNTFNLSREIDIAKAQLSKAVRGKETSWGKTRRAMRDESSVEATKEFQMLQEIHGDQKETEGLQNKPRQFILIKSKGEKTLEVGFLGARYDGDATKLARDPQFRGQQVKGAMVQVFKGLRHLHQKDIHHDDIKPENILIRKGNEGNYQVHIADLAGASRSPNRGVYTEAFTHPNDKAAFNRLVDRRRLTFLQQKTSLTAKEQIEKAALEKQPVLQPLSETDFRREAALLLQKGDVYALAQSVFEMVTGNYYDRRLGENQSRKVILSDTGTEQTFSGFSAAALQEKGIPDEVIDLLRKGLDGDHSKRPSPQDFLNALDGWN